MAAVLYTTTDQIRAVLGVTAEEIADPQNLVFGAGHTLEISLATVYPAHAALKASVEDDSATDAQKLLWIKLKVFVKYEAACCFLPQFALLVAQKITDGGTEMQRFNKDKLQDVIDAIRNARDAALGAIDPTLVNDPLFAASLFTVVPPGYDPVTNI